MTKPFMRAAAAAISLTLLFAGCSSDDDGGDTADTTEAESTESTEADDEAMAEWPRTIEHAYGSTEIEAEPTRVVSASPTLTGHFLAIDAPVVATQALPSSPLADDNGFMVQWGDVAVDQGVEAIAGPEVDLESIAAAEPDLIVGVAYGGDAVTEETYDLLSEIAPTLVFDNSGMEWQEFAPTLAEATGREAELEAAVAEFDSLVEETSAAVDTTNPVAALVVSPEGINVFTPESAHGKLLTSLGYEVVEVEGSNLEGEAGSATRTDVVSVSPELLEDELGNATLMFVFADETTMGERIEANPTLAALPAVADDRTVALGFESFRLDRFSATDVLETLASS